MPQCSYSGKLICGQSGLVFALDPADGALLWRHPVAASPRSGPPVVSGGLVQPLTDQSRRLEALDPASGRTRWKRTMPAYDGLQPAGSMLLLTWPDGQVTGVDSASGKTRWKRWIPGQSMPYFASFAGDPLAYATSTTGGGASTQVTAIAPATGDVQWATQLRGTLKPFGVSAGAVYFLAMDSATAAATAIVRYDVQSGTARRVALPVSRVGARATVRGNIVYLLAAGGSLEAMDMDARKRLWILETSVSRGSAPVAGAACVYFTAADGRLLAVDARKGTLLGQTPPRLGRDSGQVTATLPVPVLAHNHVYATAPDGTVFAVDARDPSRW
jgi:outer membrane protein assembly factor BamB